MTSIDSINSNLARAKDMFLGMADAAHRASDAVRDLARAMRPALEELQRIRWQMHRKGRAGWKRGDRPR